MTDKRRPATWVVVEWWAMWPVVTVRL